MTKTVLHIFSGDLWAGAEVMIFNLIKRLREWKDLTVIALSLNEGTLTERLRVLPVETYVISEESNTFPSILLKAVRLFKGRRIDIIHSHRYKENLLAFLLSKAIKAKRLITTIHGLPEPPSRRDGRARLTWKTRLDYFLLNHHFNPVVAVSEEMKRVLVQRYRFRAERVSVIHNGIEPPPQPLTSSNKPHLHIGTAGRMVPVKDFALFLEVAGEIKKRVEDVRFSILGEGPLKEELMRKAVDLGLGGDVEFMSPVPDPFPYYRSLDLYLNTSIHEGIPMSLLEAMSCGIPVVAPRVGGIPEIVSHMESGLLVDGRRVEGFVEMCLTLINDRDLRTTLGRNASKRVTTCFSSSRMAESYRALYHHNGVGAN